jgi:hypothetical protein
MRPIFLVAFLSLLAIALVTCHKPDPDPEPCECGEVNTVDELREWAYFKPGTYWIYEEETTGARDTFTVINSHDFVTPAGNAQFDYETIRSSDGYFYKFWFNEGWSVDDCNEGCCSCRILWCSKYVPGDFDGQDRLLTFPTFQGNHVGLAWGGGDYGLITVVDHVHHFSNGFSLYDTVVVERCDNSVLDQSASTVEYFEVLYFYAKSVGIVRKEISDSNQIRNLVECNIVQ